MLKGHHCLTEHRMGVLLVVDPFIWIADEAWSYILWILRTIFSLNLFPKYRIYARMRNSVERLLEVERYQAYWAVVHLRICYYIPQRRHHHVSMGGVGLQ
jgi:hypothetical protein